MDIKPGATIRIELTTRPTNAAATKTLIRLFRKDRKVAAHHRQQQTKRPSWQRWQRGGKMWHHQMKTEPNVRVEPGAAYQIRASVDVLRDLESVKRWIKVTSA